MSSHAYLLESFVVPINGDARSAGYKSAQLQVWLVAETETHALKNAISFIRSIGWEPKTYSRKSVTRTDFFDPDDLKCFDLAKEGSPTVRIWGKRGI